MTDRAARATDQETVARHLVNAVRAHFAGETDELAHIVRREPNEIVVLGVLDPREPPLPAPVHPDLPDEPGVPVDVLPPSELGVTVWVDTPDHADRVCFDVDIAFAAYVPVYPTWAEQHEWLTGGRADDDDDVIRTDDDDLTVGDDDVAGTADDVKEPDAPAADDISAGPDAAEIGGAADGDHGGGGSGHSGTAARRSVRFAPAFTRVDVTSTARVEIPLAAATIVADTTAQAALNAAVAQVTRIANPLRGRSRTGVTRGAFDAGEAAYEAEITERRTDTPPPLPTVEFLASSTPDPRGGWRINLTLANTAVVAARRDKPGQTVYNARFAARLDGGRYRNFGYRLADRDWRTEPQVYAHGRFCVGEVDGNEVRTNTWPIYRDRVFESRTELQPAFSDLIDDPIGTLEVIADRMDAFASDWRSYAAASGLAAERRSRCVADLRTFEDEAARFRHGITLLRNDARLLAAFIATNRSFLTLNSPNALNPGTDVARGEPKITSWRLFQIVFIVLGLPAVAATEDRSDELLAELDTADVLWFPTGGGKSEAFLGLVAVALFYDRLRGKAAGMSALIRFPLRMLSVQQLDRVLRLITACEHTRLAHHPVGDPFELGYFVGRANTPNTLTRGGDDRWGDIKRMAGWSEEHRRKNVVITTCPYCSSTDIEIVADEKTVRLDHRCLACQQRVPVVISDDEVYRTLPAVVVATVDKLAAIAFQPHLSHFSHGPAYRCPKHGYVTFALGPSGQRRCLARQFCDVKPSDWDAVAVRDPAPTLIIQDELHLLAEELGTLAAHYETLFAHLCRAGSGRPPKVIAATATISDYENQVRQLYALKPRRFPTEGYREGETFYAARLALPRRLFVGALPSRLDTAQFAIAAAKTWRAELDALRALPPLDCISTLGLTAHDAAEIDALLFRYELHLVYANRKNDAERSHEQLRRAGLAGPSRYEAEILTGDTPLADISAAIRRVEAETPATNPDPATRLAAIAGTSLVSHGVDLARLNVLHVAGMPPTNAYYVQATARAGRTDVGVVFTAFSRSFARDRAAFHFFEPQHAYSAQLVEAVSLNRFAVNAPKKTATGMLSALILNRIARDPSLNPPVDNEIPNMLFAGTFQKWLSGQHAAIDADLIEEVLTAYGLRAHVLDPVVAGYFGDAVRRRLTDELSQLRAGTALTIQKCFLNKPPTSFRDIDEPVEFGAYAYFSGKDFKTLTNRRDTDASEAGEVRHAVEDEETG